MKKNPTPLLIALLLGLVTLALYWPITRQGFVVLDDPTYVYQNSHIQAGLTWSGITWAFTSGYASNCHPLTWISHMLDCQIYGLNPGGHHFTSLLLHALNTVLVFLVFRAMTGACWRSAFVAALFAWHPLHVESVAWAAERKDVLSTLFFLLTLGTYTRYSMAKTGAATDAKHAVATEPLQGGIQPASSAVPETLTDSGTSASARPGPSIQWYLLSLLLFGLGLMSKPMLVTLPCVLLLLDFWPLHRFNLPLFRPAPANSSSLLPLLVEKIPFFALSFAACVITFLVQESGGAVASFASVPLGARLANALVAYPRYLLKTFWPVNLCVFYPLPDHWPLLPVLGAAMLLLTFSVSAFAWSRSRPYFWVGWFWFFGTLVPTIGVVQVGSQSMADRYMYIPSLGLFMIVTWGLAELSQAWSRRSTLSAGKENHLSGLVCFISAAVLLSCVMCTTRQIRYWHDEEALFRHALEATPDNYLAYDHLAKVCEQTERKPEAESLYLALLRLKPRYPEGHYNLGTLEMERGNLDAAAEHLSAAIALRPGFASAHCNLGLTRFRQNRLGEAADELRLACQLAPQNADTYVNLGVTLLAMNSPAEAADSFAGALRITPGAPGTHFLLALALSRAQKIKEAAVQAEQAHELAISAGQTEVAAKAADLLRACQSGQ